MRIVWYVISAILVITGVVMLAMQNDLPEIEVDNSNVKTMPVKVDTSIVEASCGLCNFGMTHLNQCQLAVRIDGKPRLVSGTTIDDHGDAHASDGFCQMIRKAKVTGSMANDTFFASSFELMPAK